MILRGEIKEKTDFRDSTLRGLNLRIPEENCVNERFLLLRIPSI